MTQLGPFLVLVAIIAVALAAIGGVVAWYNEEGRRIRRGLRRVLKGDTHALIIASGRGRGAGFNFTSNTMAVTWDTGGWCLIYRVEELLGVELIVDGVVAARAFRGEQRRPLDVMNGADRQVALRLVFDDPQHADFVLEFWNVSRAGRRGEMRAAEAVEEGNRWLARIESIFRRKPAAVARTAASAEPERPHSARSPTAAAEPARLRPTAAPPGAERRQELPFDADADDEPDADDTAAASGRDEGWDEDAGDRVH